DQFLVGIGHHALVLHEGAGTVKHLLGAGRGIGLVAHDHACVIGSAPATSLVQQVGGAQFEIDQGAFIVRLVDPGLEPDRCGPLAIEVGEVVASGNRYVGSATGGGQKHDDGGKGLQGACSHASWPSSAARCSNLGCTL